MPKLKLFPWLARSRGIALERAEELWRQAVHSAEFRQPGSEPASDYWAYAMRTLLRLLRVEGAALLEPARVMEVEPPRRRPALQLLASQHRLGSAAFDAAEAYLLAANDVWRRAWTPRRVR
ncbi:MAG: hypothetical protein ACREVS_07225 [Burkholderiales bacterium]